MIRIARREMLAASAAAALLPPVARAQSSADSAFMAKLDEYTAVLARLMPETATDKGLDHGELAGLRGQLDRIGPADIAAGNAAVRAVHDGVLSVDAGALSPAMQLRREAVLFSTATALEGTRFGYGGGAMVGLTGSAKPYVVSQQNGAINEVPELLSSSHPVRSAADAEAYVARVVDLARLLDEETEAMLEHASIGVTPPKFIADNALGILRNFRATPAAEQPIIANLAQKSHALGLTGHDAAAVRALDALVYPALDRQIAAMAKTTANAPMTAGVSRLPDGEAFYRWALKMGTSTNHTPQEIHRIGLEQNAAIKARMDGVLKANSMTRGTVGERMDALGRDPHNMFPDSDEGRAQILAYLEQGIARVRAIMPKLSHMTLKADVMVKRVPPSIQDGAALGYMQPAPLDGSRPAIYYINLKSTAMWPRHTLNTLTAHEGIPGHTWQLAWVAEHRAQAPAIGSLMDINAFVEGWALYAEQLVDEAGLYDSDPLSRLGYLQDQQLRACRLVVDTGMHAMGWSRAQAIDYFCNEMGKDRASSTSEIDRYCASPGQACGYKMGHNEILRLREKARKALGKRFDLAAYNDVLVSSGGVPLGLLEGLVDRYCKSA